ncbi:MAG TPA: TetR/AcrR family transcriptional regulator [Leptospiraceae bacterium]|nr:TetR/AcrR family transcriptional regulator [Leptospiraceae bacterium]HMX33310.1 TetR/AcrR family transcriptional regulator [Leptospiraceae bacterium]HMY32065.1 TetR/AcrR family transcriptional regulator [Leptospiraceae bacterium]HMZ63988.1 TetR/AcrR family transcriptional regulator [Leptospiraceae bacterium]HNA07372.1 TetR/AcrR family transcriptional regulator [Leptospiraceae bacterium]
MTDIDKKKKDILAASVQVFAEKGFHAAGIADIARKLGMGHGTFYRYFKNKEDIFHSAVNEILKEIVSIAINENPNGATNLEEYKEQLHRIGEKLFDLFSEDDSMARILFFESQGVASSQKKISDSMEIFDEYTAQYLKNGINKGFLRKDLDIKITARAINAVIFEGIKEVSPIENKKQRIKASKEWITVIISIILQGIQK